MYIRASNNGGFSFSSLAFNWVLDDTKTKATPKLLSITYAHNGESDVFKGVGFKYDANGIPIAGKVTSISHFVHGEKSFTMTDFSISAASLAKAAFSGKYQAVQKLLAKELHGDDRFVGGGMGDDFQGFGGNDRLTGGSGNDSLNGGSGKDIIYGGFDADYLQGGSGADTFIYKDTTDSWGGKAHRDYISDFSRKQGDKIDLSRIDADLNESGNQAFHYIGKNTQFSQTAGEIRVYEDSYRDGYGNKHYEYFVEADVDGNGYRDLVIRVNSLLKASDFIL